MTKLRVNLDVAALWLAYQELGSVHKVGARFGTTGDTVHHRFKRHGLKLNSEKWSEPDLVKLATYYRDTPEATFSIEDLAAALGRPYAGVALKASRLGLCDPSRGAAATTKAEMSKRSRAWHAENEHPRGMKGKTQGEAARAAVGKASRAKWAHDKRTGTGFMSDKERQRRSDEMLRRQADPSSGMRRGYSRGAQGRRADLGSKHFRSSWEANYARYLNRLLLEGRILKWEFEPDTFWFETIRRGVRSYLPDFKVWPPCGGKPYYVEVKGYMDAKSATKLKRMAKYYPDVTIKLVGAKEYKVLCNRFAKSILHWENGRDDYQVGSREEETRVNPDAVAALTAPPTWLQRGG